MNDYEVLYHDRDINKIIDSTNEMLNKMTDGALIMCHGRYHTMFVVDTIEQILRSLSYDSRIIELGKIAALLHDIGCIAGRWNHAQKSAALTKVYLDSLENFSCEEKNMVVQAIEDHSDGKNIKSAVGAALLIADKIDFSGERVLPSKKSDIGNRNNLEIESVDIIVFKKMIKVDCVTTEAFSKDIFRSGYIRYNMLIKAAKYLGYGICICFNGIEENC